MNIILNGKRLEAEIRYRKECQCLLLTFSIVLKVLARAIRQEVKKPTSLKERSKIISVPS
jgi:hypothetical protein